jgi:hypothetical protein
MSKSRKTTPFPEKEILHWMPLVQLLLHKLDIAFRQGMEQCKSVINVASPCQNTSALFIQNKIVQICSIMVGKDDLSL